MPKLFQILNPRIGLDGHHRQWIELGQPLSISKQRQYRLMCDRVNDQYHAIFAEEIHGHYMRSHTIQDGHWRCEVVPKGYLEIIPKVVRYDKDGRVDAVLVELLLTPAELAHIN